MLLPTGYVFRDEAPDPNQPPKKEEKLPTRATACKNCKSNDNELFSPPSSARV